MIHLNLTPIEEIRRDPENKNILNVRCNYCNKWYRPDVNSVTNRAASIDNGTCNFYCSEECKLLCSDYGQIIYPKGFKNPNSRAEVDLILRKLVFERDKWICQKCDDTKSLECHHIDPVALEPLFANDIDSCITLCKKCYKWIHKNIDKCGYHEISKEKQKRKQNC